MAAAIKYIHIVHFCALFAGKDKKKSSHLSELNCSCLPLIQNSNRKMPNANALHKSIFNPAINTSNKKYIYNCSFLLALFSFLIYNKPYCNCTVKRDYQCFLIKKLFTIGQFAKLHEINKKTLIM